MPLQNDIALVRQAESFEVVYSAKSKICCHQRVLYLQGFITLYTFRVRKINKASFQVVNKKYEIVSRIYKVAYCWFMHVLD